jgi:endonuclease/exonuclease/phosphatase family metal-dependent hydrolase
MRTFGRARSVRMAVAALVAVTVAAGAPLASEAGGTREVTVMTRNLYLGASLAPALAARTEEQVVLAAAQIYGTMLFTNFPARAAAIADEIAHERPDLIGLQEVSRWTAIPTHPGPTPPSLDFLTILQEQLVVRGLTYVVAAESDNADIGNPAVAPIPLIAPSFGCQAPQADPTFPDCLVRLQDRDVILRKVVDGLSTSNPRSEHFDAQVVITLPGAPAPLSFDRGWVSVDVSFDGAKFRFLDTHLETEDFPTVQEAQARELLAGPMRPGQALVAVGDFNSAADGSTTDTHRILIKSGLIDAWWTNLGRRGFTCCRNETLTSSELTERIDLILTRRALPIEAHRVGVTPFQAIPPLWASDHAGVVADVLVF